MADEKETHDHLQSFFPETLIDMGERDLPSNIDEQVIQLDKNELPYEIGTEIKEQILNELKLTNWNRYPSPYYPVLESYIAKYAGVNSDSIVLGIGAGHLIDMLFNLFGRKNLVIAHPSFSLFEFLCRAYGIQYKKWKLDEQFNYTASTLPTLNNQTVVVLASPNNPTGTLIKKDLLESLLKENPQTLFVVDEVYSEFSQMTNKELLKDYSNLILIRSFSKAFGLAGVRAGYLISSKSIAKHLRKIVLPFVLNHYSEITLKTILTNEDILNNILGKINQVRQERNRIYNELKALEVKKGFSVYPSHANFLLIRFQDKQKLYNYLFELSKKQIHVLNLSHVQELENSIRITIGKPVENDKVLDCLLRCDNN
jgi:histidinol-phosphate aminotransferase